MNFAFTPGPGLGLPASIGPFRVERLTRNVSGRELDISHLIDRTYDYQSPRELRWHLAERFELPVQIVTLRSH